MNVEQVKELLKGVDRAKLSAMLVELKELGLDFSDAEKRQYIPRAPKIATRVKNCKIVTKHMTCLNCGYQWIHTLELKRGEGACFTSVRGMYSITVTEDFTPLTVECKTVKCEHCTHAITKWSREELEERYMQLLCRLAIGFDVQRKQRFVE